MVRQGGLPDALSATLTASCKSYLAISQMMDYNVKGGKLNRGMAVSDTLQALKKVVMDSA